MLEWEGRPWRYASMRALIFPLFFLLLPSCSLFEKKEEKPLDDGTKPRLVGRVAQVPGRGDFVLVEFYGAWKVPDGGLLAGVGAEGRTSNLVATGEKLGQYAAADIRSGLAKVGDSVYYRPLADPNQSTEIGKAATEGEKAPELETQKEGGETPAKP